MTDITCVNSINGSSTGVLLTNKIRSFRHTATFESGLSDCHTVILTFFRAHFKKLSKIIEYRNFKNFYQNDFLQELDFELSKGTIYKFVNQCVIISITKYFQYGIR